MHFSTRSLARGPRARRWCRTRRWHGRGRCFRCRLAHEVAGDHAGARESWSQARSELEPFLKEQPEKFVLIGDLALINMALGDNAAALTLAERAIAMIPIEKDALTGPRPLDIPARVAVRIGNSERAITTLEKAACDSVRSTARHKPAARPCVAPAAREIGGNALEKKLRLIIR